MALCWGEAPLSIAAFFYNLEEEIDFFCADSLRDAIDDFFSYQPDKKDIQELLGVIVDNDLHAFCHWIEDINYCLENRRYPND